MNKQVFLVPLLGLDHVLFDGHTLPIIGSMVNVTNDANNNESAINC
jgi:hypothetical protein